MRQGQVLAGRYRLEAMLGQGGMGHVWGGRDLDLDRPVAVKVVPDASREDLTARLRREGRIITWLNEHRHPSIATVFDVGDHDGCLYLVMELLPGSDLQTVSGRHPLGLEVRTVIGYGIRISESLAAAHEAGIVHRDVKPANIIVTEDGGVKICDFGTAQMAGSTAGLADHFGLMGTPRFMAPEQFADRRTDPRTDLYALGCTLYALLTGAPPFNGTFTELRRRHLEERPRSVRSHRDDVPQELSALIGDLLAKEPAERPSDGRVVAQRLRAVRASGR
ncbi:serine/threonine-protein kinase [Kitasatospora sp. NBC_01539]|uniref:serine/threonine-protein kinase n=1 Tax=Kitasatospora sp. NBC_01539 TaxID=2903577 RepID=UPI0038601665